MREALDSAVIAADRRGLGHAAPGRRAAARRARSGSTAGRCSPTRGARSTGRRCARFRTPCGGARRARAGRVHPRRKGFRHIDLHVDPRVLVPRPETELLVEAALGLPHGARVVDVGTGSGAIALALKDERPDLEVIGDRRQRRRARGGARERARARPRRHVRCKGDLLGGRGRVRRDPLQPALRRRRRPRVLPEMTRHEPARRAVRAATTGWTSSARLVAAGRADAAVPARDRGRRGPGAGGRGARCARRGFREVEARPDLAGHRARASARRPAKAAAGWRRATARRRRGLRALHRAPAASRSSPPTRSTASRATPSATAVARLYELKGRPPDKPAAVMFFALEPRSPRCPSWAAHARARRSCCRAA